MAPTSPCSAPRCEADACGAGEWPEAELARGVLEARRGLARLVTDLRRSGVDQAAARLTRRARRATVAAAGPASKDLRSGLRELQGALAPLEERLTAIEATMAKGTAKDGCTYDEVVKARLLRDALLSGVLAVEAAGADEAALGAALARAEAAGLGGEAVALARTRATDSTPRPRTRAPPCAQSCRRP